MIGSEISRSFNATNQNTKKPISPGLPKSLSYVNKTYAKIISLKYSKHI